jgi:hypothetical protein
MSDAGDEDFASMLEAAKSGLKEDFTSLLCIHEMERDYLRETAAKKCTCLFEPDLREIYD